MQWTSRPGNSLPTHWIVPESHDVTKSWECVNDLFLNYCKRRVRVARFHHLSNFRHLSNWLHFKLSSKNSLKPTTQTSLYLDHQLHNVNDNTTTTKNLKQRFIDPTSLHSIYTQVCFFLLFLRKWMNWYFHKLHQMICYCINWTGNYTLEHWSHNDTVQQRYKPSNIDRLCKLVIPPQENYCILSWRSVKGNPPP